LPYSSFADANLYRAHLPKLDQLPATRPLAYPRERIINGNDYIGSDNDANESCIILKGTAVGAQSVQSAFDMPDMGHAVDRVFWVANKDLHTLGSADAWVPGARNQLEIAGTTSDDDLTPNNAAQRAELATHFSATVNPLFENARENRLVFFRDRLFKLEHHELASVRIRAATYDTPEAIECTFGLTFPRGQAITPQMREAAANRAQDSLVTMLHDAGFSTSVANATVRGLPSEAILSFLGRNRIALDLSNKMRVGKLTADFLVYSMGQELGETAEGTPSYMAAKLDNKSGMFSAISNFAVGLTGGGIDNDVAGAAIAVDGGTAAGGVVRHVRILGAAMLSSGFLTGGPARTFTDRHKAHFESLPKESTAAMGGGINPAVTNIKRANQFTDPLLKINTASHAELLQANLTDIGAAMIIIYRSGTDRGFTVLEYQAKLIVDALLGNVGDDGAAVAQDAMIVTAATFAF
jgi:hypothetical protein